MMFYKKGDKVRVTEEFKSRYNISEIYLIMVGHNSFSWEVLDSEGILWSISDDDILGLYKPRSRKRKPVDLSYRMAMKDGEG